MKKLKTLAVANPYASPHLKNIGTGYRVRQGKWRALVLINDKQRVVMVDRVLDRRDAY